MHQQEVVKDYCEKITVAAEVEGEICFSWIERDDDDLSRRGTMYCFKSCSVNNN